MDLMAVANQYGPLGVVLLGMYLMVRQQQRFIENTLVDLIKNNTQAMNNLQGSVAAMEKAIDRQEHQGGA
jgi:hypothetical protein